MVAQAAPEATFPPLRLQEFREHRVRRPIRGSLVGDHSDHLLNDPVASQLNKWLSLREHFVLAPFVEHVSTEVGDGERFISVCYFVLMASKLDAVQLLYGR